MRCGHRHLGSVPTSRRLIGTCYILYSLANLALFRNSGCASKLPNFLEKCFNICHIFNDKSKYYTLLQRCSENSISSDWLCTDLFTFKTCHIFIYECKKLSKCKQTAIYVNKQLFVYIFSLIYPIFTLF